MSIKTTYQLTENDLVEGHMYQASQSAAFQKQRKRVLWLYPGIYLAIGLVFIAVFNDVRFGLFMVFVSLLWFVFYRFIFRKRYARYYRRYVRDNQSDKLHTDVEIEFTDEYIHSKMGLSETKVHVSDIINAVELTDIIIVRLNGGQGLVIPKRFIADINPLKSFFHQHNLSFDTLSDWKFK